MNLDCIEGSGTKASNTWIIVDYDNKQKEFASGESVEEAWFCAAMKLEKRINNE